MGAALTQQQAMQVYQVLVEACGASADPSDEFAFVHEYSTDSQYSPAREWRFQGVLGFGGKFRYPQLVVDCYPEDETPARLAAIEIANARLIELRMAFGLNQEGRRIQSPK